MRPTPSVDLSHRLRVIRHSRAHRRPFFIPFGFCRPETTDHLVVHVLQSPGGRFGFCEGTAKPC